MSTRWSEVGQDLDWLEEVVVSAHEALRGVVPGVFPDLEKDLLRARLVIHRLIERLAEEAAKEHGVRRLRD